MTPTEVLIKAYLYNSEGRLISRFIERDSFCRDYNIIGQQDGCPILGFKQMTPKEINISFEEWDYTCGDGCCYDYGITLKVGDESIVDYAEQNIENTIVKLLEHLGYKVNVSHVQQDNQ